jgi:hypothetical protein
MMLASSTAIAKIELAAYNLLINGPGRGRGPLISSRAAAPCQCTEQPPPQRRALRVSMLSLEA